MCPGKGLLVDLTETSTLHDYVRKWDDRVQVVSARCYERPVNLEAMLIRSDGYVAWALRPGVGEEGAKTAVCGALQKWFGTRR
jgi:hypothetical protein